MPAERPGQWGPSECSQPGHRVLYLCWKGSTNAWLLSEDSEAAAQMQGEEGGERD
jgi:hypothetical protein